MSQRLKMPKEAYGNMAKNAKNRDGLSYSAKRWIWALILLIIIPFAWYFIEGYGRNETTLDAGRILSKMGWGVAVYFFVWLHFGGKEQAALDEHEAGKRECYLRENQYLETAELVHVTGLPLTSGCVCTIALKKKEFLFLYDEKQIHLPHDRILDVIIRVDKEVQNYYVGVGYNGIRKISETEIERFLVITYLDKSETKHICFVADDVPEANRIAEIWKAMPRASMHVDL